MNETISAGTVAATVTFTNETASVTASDQASDGNPWPAGAWQRLAGTAEGGRVIAAAGRPLSLAEARALLGDAARSRHD